MVIVAVKVWPVVTLVGTLALTTDALLPTLIVVVNVCPNQATRSWTIFHANVYVQGVTGAVALKVNLAFWPGLTGEDGPQTRFVPQVELSCGLCEPSR